MELKKQMEITLLLSLSVVLSIIESFIPIFSGVIPGFKVGLANIIVLFVIYIFSFKDAVIVSVLRVFLMGILRTGLFSITFFFSLSGSLLSLLIMWIAFKITKLSIVGVSVLGAVSHTIGQVLMAIVIIDSYKLIYYLPFVLLFSIPSGIVVGLISRELVNYFEKVIEK